MRYRLKFQKFDGRGSHCIPIIDQDTGEEVGYIMSNGVGMYSSGGIRVSLFDDKYVADLNTYEQCKGFVEGVETVLNRMVHIKDRKFTKSEAA
jgi:hypothetical protein